MAKQQPKQEIPKTLLRQINEHTNGGFVLFYLHKDGSPKIFTNSDTVIHASALNYFVQNWAKAIEAYNIESIVQYLDQGDKQDDDSDESEG